MTMGILQKFGAILIFSPIFFAPGVVLCAVGGFCGQVYIKAQLSVKRYSLKHPSHAFHSIDLTVCREMSNSRSPLYSHFNAAINGITSIRAYGAEDAFIKESLRRVDKYTRPARTFYNLNRWVTIRVDALSGLFAASLAAYLIYFQPMDAGNTGFQLTMAISFSGMILWWVRVLNEFEVEGKPTDIQQGCQKITCID